MPEPEKVERNDWILRLVLDEGRRQRDVALLFGITPQRVSQVVQTAWERQIREGRRAAPPSW